MSRVGEEEKRAGREEREREREREREMEFIGMTCRLLSS